MIGWLDLSSGVSGDMLLGALADAGVPLDVLSEWCERAGLPIELTAERVTRCGLAATRVRVASSEQEPPERTWRQIRELLQREPAAPLAEKTFATLAAAEARVHGTAADEVHFHEVGALDALADVTGVCAGFAWLHLESLAASVVALGGGSAPSGHGTLPVPSPAVLDIARAASIPSNGGGEYELCTPTGAALIANLVSTHRPMPPMVVKKIGIGAGSRDLPDRPNVVRLVIGEPVLAELPANEALVLSANVDDLDPRAWPVVLDALLAAGADDAWLAPILMKKGRPAHTVNALVGVERLAAVRQVFFRETSTLGVRESPARKTMLRREFHSVEVGGDQIAVKVGLDATGQVVNAMPEWDDVVRVAERLGRPVKQVLAEAQAAYGRLPAD